MGQGHQASLSVAIMKKIILLICLQAVWTAGYSQSLPPDMTGGISFQRTNLVVHWKASKHPWPKTMSVLSMVPTKFSPAVVSNLMALGSFTQTDKTETVQDRMHMLRFSKDRTGCSFNDTVGVWGYSTQYDFRLNPPTINIPTTNQLSHWAAEILPKVGIQLSEIAKDSHGKPKFGFEEYIVYSYPKHTNAADFVIITNIPYVEVAFARAVDGVKFYHFDGLGEIDFGEHGEIFRINLEWPDYERLHSYSAATPKQIIQWIREGHAKQSHMLQLNGPETVIDWSTVKSLTITNAAAYYEAEFFDWIRLERPIFPSYARPFAELSGTVDTGTTNLFVVIRCPVIDENKPLK